MDPLRRAGAPPSVRTVRYYTDLGLVDAPSARRGLHAIYGQRHFLQLLGITLPGGIIMLLPVTRQLSDAELESLQRAAAPLAAVATQILAQRGGADVANE